jgi:hypothetical protein
MTVVAGQKSAPRLGLRHQPLKSWQVPPLRIRMKVNITTAANVAEVDRKQTIELSQKVDRDRAQVDR